jgi:hypothetical protein
VFAEDGTPRLVAAVEFVSPRNEERPQARHAFADKCVGYLQQSSSLVIVDTVTTRKADLHATILSLLQVYSSNAVTPSNLSAVSYHAIGREKDNQQLQLWPEPLTLGQPLPTLPLWIAPDFSVPLDLDVSYQATCTDLRIRQVR